MKKLSNWKNKTSNKTYFLAVLGLSAMAILLTISLHSGTPGISMAAILAGPYLRGARNKFAGGVIYKHLGETCLRERVTPTNTITGKKTDAQGRFKLVIPFLKLMDGLISSTSSTSKKGQSKFNRMVGYNLKNAINGSGVVGSKVWSWIWSQFSFALGSLTNPSGFTATNPTNQTIVFAWIDNSGEGKAVATDQFNYLYVNTSTGEQINGLTTQKRSDQSYSFSAPAGWSGDNVAVYGNFVSEDGKNRSDSMYAATLTLH